MISENNFATPNEIEKNFGIDIKTNHSIYSTLSNYSSLIVCKSKYYPLIALNELAKDDIQIFHYFSK